MKAPVCKLRTQMTHWNFELSAALVKNYYMQKWLLKWQEVYSAN